MAISVNILRLRVTSEVQPRSKNGLPPHRTTGLAIANWTQPQVRSEANPSSGRPGMRSAMAMTKTGRLRTRLTQNRRVMSTSSGLGASSRITVVGSSAMPQSGQSPGSSRKISGCMGQVYRVSVACSAGAAGSTRLRNDSCASTSYSSLKADTPCLTSTWLKVSVAAFKASSTIAFSLSASGVGSGI